MGIALKLTGLFAGFFIMASPSFADDSASYSTTADIYASMTTGYTVYQTEDAAARQADALATSAVLAGSMNTTSSGTSSDSVALAEEITGEETQTGEADENLPQEQETAKPAGSAEKLAEAKAAYDAAHVDLLAKGEEAKQALERAEMTEIDKTSALQRWNEAQKELTAAIEQGADETIVNPLEEAVDEARASYFAKRELYEIMKADADEAMALVRLANDVFQRAKEALRQAVQARKEDFIKDFEALADEVKRYVQPVQPGEWGPYEHYWVRYTVLTNDFMDFEMQFSEFTTYTDDEAKRLSDAKGTIEGLIGFIPTGPPAPAVDPVATI